MYKNKNIKTSLNLKPENIQNVHLFRPEEYIIAKV